MLNTNGIRIAKEPGFAERLATYAPRFEIYLQFDSLRNEVLQALRGADLRAVRLDALDALDRVNLSTTLVCTLRRGLNDDEVGDLLRFAMGRRCVRGVTLQPVQDAGRNDAFDAQLHRLTVSEVRRAIYEQFPIFAPEDVLPVPCHPDSLAMAYALKADDGTLVPLTRYVSPETLLSAGKNTIVYERDDAFQREVASKLFATFSTAHGPESASESLRTLLCCLPQVQGMPTLGYDRVFRVIVMQFLDRHTMDLRSVRKSCVHIAHPDGERVMPFDTYNVLYRDALEPETLVPLRVRHGQRRELAP
jgi:uncharacterized radical SAM superfamily Fe-S cluster-containing enzyme